MTGKLFYHLPEERIARFPIEKRDHSKLLVYRNKIIEHKFFYDLPDILPDNSLLVFNNTKVIHARFYFTKKSGAKIEILCLEPSGELTAQLSAVGESDWKCMIGNLKKWKNNEPLILSQSYENEIIELSAQFADEMSELQKIKFRWNSQHTFAQIMMIFGNVPLPPYLKREATGRDKESYQTIYAQNEGAIAAPTAGLHFTPEIFEKLSQKGIKKEFITLHVGAGTFLPVKTDNLIDHPMHCEKMIFTKTFIENLYLHNGILASVGTTSLRALESLYCFGVKLADNPEATFFIEKLFPYKKNLKPISKKTALKNVLNFLERIKSDILTGITEIMIMPGYHFCFGDALITNFHQPESTLLSLVAAFTSNNWQQIYQSALENNYRFLSYGDSSLIFGKSLIN